MPLLAPCEIDILRPKSFNCKNAGNVDARNQVLGGYLGPIGDPR